MKKGAALLAAGVCGALCVAFGLPAQAEQASVMDLDVTVSRGGHPATALTRDDFEVRLDGATVATDYFAEVRGGLVLTPDVSTLSPDLVLKPSDRDNGAAVPRHILLEFDTGAIPTSAMESAVSAARQFIERLRPSDEAMVIEDTAAGPRVRAEWTADHASLLAALKTISRSGSDMDVRQYADAERAVRLAPNSSARLEHARKFASQATERVRRRLENFSDSLCLLSGKLGKKVVIEISGGFELQPGAALLTLAGPKASATAEANDIGAELQTLVDRANAMEITLYAARAEALQARRPGPALPAGADAGLYRLAEETGGIALLKFDPAAPGFARILHDLASYYSLGVDLKYVTPGVRHRVDVVVDEPGLVVRARRSYTVLTADQRIQDKLEASLLEGTTFADIGVTLKMGKVRREAGTFTVPLEVAVPARDLSFTLSGNSASTTAEYYLWAVGSRGTKSPLSKTVQSFTLPAAQANSSSPVLEKMRLRLRRGSYDLVVNVRDPATGRLGTARTIVSVE